MRDGSALPPVELWQALALPSKGGGDGFLYTKKGQTETRYSKIA